MYIVGFGVIWGFVFWIFVFEIFFFFICVKGVFIGVLSNWVNNFVIVFFVFFMFKVWEWGIYIFFVVFLFVGILWVWFFLLEIKNVLFEEMDCVFKSWIGE